jgi:uncharacterized RDD family membrane protein YckC
MGAIKVPTNFNIELEFEVPEFYRRMLALIIDMVIEFFYFKIAMEIMKSLEDNSWDSDSSLNNQAIWMLLFLPIALYHVLMEVTMNGQSVGKKIMGLRVVDEKGGKASVSQFIIRWLLRVSDLWMIMLWALLAYLSYFGGSAELVFIAVLGFGFLITDIVLVVSSKKGQRIGDILAHTIIIRTNPQSDIGQTVFQEVSDNYTPSFPEIMKLSDKDINAIKSILETAKKKGDFNMAANASDKIKGHLKIDTSMSPFDFLETLLKDYNYLSTK